jgi:Right handed beta helix region/Protein of unknown function (DUF1565)
MRVLGDPWRRASWRAGVSAASVRRAVALLGIGALIAFVAAADIGSGPVREAPDPEDLLAVYLQTPAMAPDGTERARDTSRDSVHHLAPRGRDSNPGTAARPWRTIGRAARTARPGDTLVLHPGVYGRRGTTTRLTRSGSPSAPITFRAGRGERRPKIVGHVRVDGDHVQLRQLIFEGPTGEVNERSSDNPLGQEVQLAIYGDGVLVADSIVRDNLYHAGIYLSSAHDARLLRNYIHDNGNFGRPEEANLDQGIYFGSGSGLIANNVIVRNLAHGVQIYPRATDVLVTQNTIVGNGRAGVLVGEDAANTLIVNNVVASNGDVGIRSYGLEGTDNVVRRNVVFGNANGNLGDNAEGLSLRGNIRRDPHFRAPNDWRLRRPSPAVDRAVRRWSLRDDHDLRRRPHGGGPDIGAFESW